MMVSMKVSSLYFEWFEVHIRMKGRRTPAYLSAENKPVYQEALANYFDTEEEAFRRIKRLPKGMGVFTVVRMREYLPPPPGPCPGLIRQLLNDIPLPYSLTAAAWYEGTNVRHEPISSAIPLSRSTYYRHRRKLLEYGIDIGKKCNVHILRFRWDQIRSK